MASQLDWIDVGLVVALMLPIIIALLIVMSRLAAWERARWEAVLAANPPLTEEEFLERLGPDVDRDIALRVRAIVAESSGWPVERIGPQTRWIDL